MSLPLPLGVVRAVLRYGVKPVYGPPMPIAVQRFWGDQMARLQRVPSSVTVRRVQLGARPAVRYAGPGARSDVAVLWAHGGAFITGSARTHGSFAAHLALASRLPVYLLDYRLAPEHKHPAAVDDLVAAVPLIPEARVVIGGDSAGGALALFAAARVSVDAVALVSPLVDLTHESASAWTGDEALVRSDWAALGVRSMFGAVPPAVPDPTVPTIVHVAEHERLRPEGEALAKRVGAELVLVSGGWHDIHLQAGLVRQAARAVDQLGASIAALAP